MLKAKAEGVPIDLYFAAAALSSELGFGERGLACAKPAGCSG